MTGTSDQNAVAKKADVPAHVLKDICTALGMFVYQWSQLETSLTFWIAIIFHDAGGKHVDATLPLEWKRKVRYLRRCFSSLTALKPFSVEAVALLDRAQKVVDVRHFVIHGYVSRYDEDRQHALTFTRIDVDRESMMHKETRLMIRLAELIEKGNECSQIALLAGPFTRRLMEHFVPQNQLRDALSRLADEE